MKIKKILTPVDFSGNSVNALRYAAAFARTTGAGIFIMHITDPDSLENELKGNLDPDHLTKTLRESDYLKGIQTTVILEKGGVSKMILDEAKKNDVDLIVMGTLGAGTMKRNLIGTNTTHVVSKSDCAVLVVPADAAYQPIRKVVLAIDMEHKSDRIIEQILNLLKQQNAAVLMLYVGKDKDGQFARELVKLTEEMKSKTGYERILSKVITNKEFPESLERYALDIEADMLVMITHHRGVFEAIFDPSITKVQSYHTAIPLLVIPHHKTPVFFI